MRKFHISMIWIRIPSKRLISRKVEMTFLSGLLKWDSTNEWKKNWPKQTHSQCECKCLSWCVWVRTGEYGGIRNSLVDVRTTFTWALLDNRLDQNEECIEAFFSILSRSLSCCSYTQFELNTRHDYIVFCLSGIRHSCSSNATERQWDEKCGTERLWSVRFFPD